MLPLQTEFYLTVKIKELCFFLYYNLISFYQHLMQKNKWDFFIFLVLEVLAMLITGAVALSSKF